MFWIILKQNQHKIMKFFVYLFSVKVKLHLGVLTLP